MKKKRLGVITLAITLISLGVLLLLNNFIDIDIFTTFSIMWPCIIILFGLEMILARLIYRKRNQDISISLDTLSIILLIIIVISTSAISNINMIFSRINFFEDGIRISPNFNVLYKYDSRFSKDYTLESSGKEGIDIINSFGNVEVYKSTSDKIEVNTVVSFKHNDEEFAKEISNKIIRIDDSDSIIRILSDIDSLQQDRERIGDISVSFYIKAPSNMIVDIKNKFGNVTVDGIGKDVSVSNSHGNIKVRSINSKLSVDNSFGEVDIDKADGEVIVNNKHGNVKVNNIKGGLVLTNAFGNVEAMNINGNAEIENSHNNILVRKVSGNVRIVGKYGKVEIEEISGKLTVENNNGNIVVDNIKDEVNLVNRFGNIDISDVSKSLKIISNNGNISYSTVSQIEQELDIDNEFGNINVILPSEQKGNFNIITVYGKINDRFGFNIKENLNEQSVNENIGENEVKIDIRNRNGDIRIQAN